jgi:hypothetical protein
MLLCKESHIIYATVSLSLPPSLPPFPPTPSVFVTLQRNVSHGIEISQDQMQLNLLNIKWGDWEFQVFFILYFKVTSFGKKSLRFDTINASHKKGEKEKIHSP